MRGPAAFFSIALALGAIILAPVAGAQSQDAREGPIEIEKCQTISHPGSYKLANNLSTTGDCMVITADFVNIDLAGFTISGPGGFPKFPTGIAAGHDTTGITVRNGSITGFDTGVGLEGNASMIEGLRVFGGGCPCRFGIVATGIVKGNTVVGIPGLQEGSGNGAGISATGIVTGNYVSGTRVIGIDVGQGSTVIGNNVTFSRFGMVVSCPSNVTDNTADAFQFNGTGCNNTNNVGPPGVP